MLKNKKIVIVGAGISGLAAAEKLYQNGFRDITILESRNRVGGRISSFKEGAQWIHGETGNIIHQVIKEHGLQTKGNINRFSKNKFFTESGIQLSEENYKSFDAALCFLSNCVSKDDAQQSIKDPELEQNMEHYYSKKWTEYINTNSNFHNLDPNLLQAVLKSFSDDIKSHDGCDSLAQLNLSTYFVYKELPGGHLMVKNGFSSIPQAIAEGLSNIFIKLNCKVELIKWNASKNGAVKILFNDGGVKKTITADHVIVTVSLGCLKEFGNKLFEPQLPLEKMNAIKRMGFGVTDKIIFEYDKPFWDSNTDVIILLWDKVTKNGEKADFWFRSISNILVVADISKNYFTLQFWLSGKHAKAMETISNQKISAICTNLLNQFTDYKNIPDPKEVYVSRWFSDVNSLGSYSYMAAGASVLDIQALAEPVYNEQNSPCICFSGEATHQKFYSTVHGAYLTGVREATRLFKYYQTN